MDKKFTQELENHIFIVLGYGIKQNPLDDIYLKLVFNYLVSQTANGRILKIICSGGNTDMFPPFLRYEATEMVKALKKFKDRKFIKKINPQWDFMEENKSLSTLENLFFSSEIIKQNFIGVNQISIFCEYTRRIRIKKLAKIIFNEIPVKIVAFDFDTSQSRYLPKEIITRKENTLLALSLWALENNSNFKWKRKLFEKKVNYFRSIYKSTNSHIMYESWDRMIQEIEDKIRK